MLPTRAPRRRPGLQPEELAFIEQKIAELKARIPEGGLREAVDPFHALYRTRRHLRRRARLRRCPPPAVEEYSGLPLAEFKQKLREQFFMLLLDEESAVRAIPAMLPEDREQRERWFAMVQEIMLGSRRAERGAAPAPRSRRRAVRGRSG